jgi:hypothetical protein
MPLVEGEPATLVLTYDGLSQPVDEETGDVVGMTTDESAAQFGSALQALPILDEINTIAASFDDLQQRSSSWVVGDVLSVSEPVVRPVSGTDVVCESEEGVASGAACTSGLRVMYVDLELRVDDVVAGPDSRRAGDIVTISLAIDTVPEGNESADVRSRRASAVAELTRTAPVGRQMVIALATASDTTHAAAFGLLDPDGRILPLDSYPGGVGVGLAETSTIDVLRSRLDSSQ